MSRSSYRGEDVAVVDGPKEPAMILLPRPLVLGLALAAPCVAQQPQTDYLVLCAVAADDAFDAAAQHLAEHRAGEVVRFDPDDLAPVRAALDAARPRHVALVMRPEQLDFAFQRRFLQLATEVDDDPFVDFAFGYVTGASADEALALAKRGTSRAPRRAETFGEVAGGLVQSARQERPSQLGDASVPTLRLHSAGEKAFPDEGRDRAFLAKHLPELKGRDVVTFIGHGYPHEVHGGPDCEDVRALDLDGAVALNVACYTGTTSRWFEHDYRERVVVDKQVGNDESFCLHVLRSGVVGYTAYLCPRPAGPELDTDRTALVFDGASLGEARRRDYDKTVLGFLGFGEWRLALEDVEGATKIARYLDAVRDLMLEGATGGVVFGDPACVPFARRDDSPVTTEVEHREGRIVVRHEVAANVLWTHCNDPTASWGDGMARKVHVRVPLHGAHVTDVAVADMRVGRDVVPTRLLWAIEDDRGERFLQCKVNFPSSRDHRGEVRCVLHVETTGDAAAAKLRGGETQQRKVRGAVHAAPAKGDPFALARERGISRDAVGAALAAARATMGGLGDEAEAVALAKLAEHGRDGFEATLCLLECGRSHYRMHELLRATWQPGYERRLIALASGPPLPEFAMWSVIKGLGVADTPEVRAYLADRLQNDDDAGTWMSTAEALAMLGAREHVAAIGARILEFRRGWSGVEPHLIHALGRLGGADAVKQLEKIASVEHCKNWKSALAQLDKLDEAAAARVRAQR